MAALGRTVRGQQLSAKANAHMAASLNSHTAEARKLMAAFAKEHAAVEEKKKELARLEDEVPQKELRNAQLDEEYKATASALKTMDAALQRGVEWNAEVQQLRKRGKRVHERLHKVTEEYAEVIHNAATEAAKQYAKRKAHEAQN